MKCIMLAVFSIIACAHAAEPLRLNMTLDRGQGGTNHAVTFSWQAKSNHIYEIQCFDIGNAYAHKVFYGKATNDGVMTVTMPPSRVTDEDVPVFSGQAWWYLIETYFWRTNYPTGL